MGLTADELIAGAKVRAFYPATGGPLTDVEILRLADGELTTTVFPRILTAKGSFSVYTKEHSIASGTTRYRIPKAAHLGRVKDVRFRDAEGDERSVDLIDVSERPLTSRQWSRDGFCVYAERGDIVIAQTPTESYGTLLINYYRRPGQLALVADCGRVTSIAANGANTRLTCSAGIPSTWTASTVLDLIQGGGVFDNILVDQTPAALSTVSDTVDIPTTTLSLTAAEVGDYIAAAGYSPFPQVPAAAHTWLEQLIAVKILETERDMQALALAQAKADKLEAALIEVLAPRVDNEAEILVPHYSPYRCM